MKKIILLIVILLLTFINCNTGKVKEICLSYTGSVAKHKYWLETFVVDLGAELELDFEVTSGGPVDILIMNKYSFHQFEDHITIETITTNFWSLAPEEYGVEVVQVNAYEQVVFSYGCVICSLLPPVPVDVYVTDSINFLLYESGQPFEYYMGHDSVAWAIDTFEILISQTLYSIIDNTSMHGSMPVDTADCCFTAERFVGKWITYYKDASVLNTDSVSYTFEAPIDTVYLIVNNSGYVEGGAFPIGSVDFSIQVTEK